MAANNPPEMFHSEEPLISLGALKILGGSVFESDRFPLRNLTEGLSIVGSTGSGKTCAAQHILRQLWHDHRIPFMVLGSLHDEYDAIPGIDDMLLRHARSEDSTSFLFFDSPEEEIDLAETYELPLYLPVVIDTGDMDEADIPMFNFKMIRAMKTHLDETELVHKVTASPRHVLLLEYIGSKHHLLHEDLKDLASYGHAVILLDQLPTPLHEYAGIQLRTSS